MKNGNIIVTELQDKPAALSLSWILLLLIANFSFSHPGWVFGLFFFSVAVLILCGGQKRLYYSFLFGLPMSLLIIITNILTVRTGTQVLYRLTFLPFFPDGQTFYVEPLIYGGLMSLRLFSVTIIFLIYNLIVPSDRLMKSIKGKKGHLVTTIALALRLMPMLLRDLKRIMEVYRCRGVRIDSGTLKEKIKAIGWISGVLLQSSLERSINLAESMAARNYGAAESTVYHQERWEYFDKIQGIIIITSGFLLVLMKLMGIMAYSFYPRLTPFEPLTQSTVLLLMLFFVFICSPFIICLIKIKERGRADV